MQKTETVNLKEIESRLRYFSLSGMADMLKSMEEDGTINELSAQNVLNSLTIEEEQIRKDRRYKRLVRNSGLYYPSASIPGIIKSDQQRMNMALLDSLLTCEYIQSEQPVWILGSAGTGKTYICSILGNQACMLQYAVKYYATSSFFLQCAEADMNGRFYNFIHDVCKNNLIILDDFLLTGITFNQATFLFELLNYPKSDKKPRAIMVCSQLMEEEMKLRLSDVSPSLAEAIMSRLKAKRLVLEITGKDMRIGGGSEEK